MITRNLIYGTGKYILYRGDFLGSFWGENIRNIVILLRKYSLYCENFLEIFWGENIRNVIRLLSYTCG